MAEVAGLALGVVGLAGVIGALKDVIDLCSLVIDSTSWGRDYEILSTKFDIERTLLLQWARRTNILQPSYDRRLDDPTTQNSVLGILSCIRLLLSNEAALKDRYGLQCAKKPAAEDTTSRNSGPLMGKFFQEFEAFSLRIDRHSQTTKWPTKFRWVIRDKSRFENLINEMSHFTTKLNEVLPIVNSAPHMQIINEQDFSGMSLNDLQIILEASSRHKDITESAKAAIVHICQGRILRRLWFRTIDDREQAVAPAYGKTLQWALEPPQKDFEWDDLSHWLRVCSGIYWISGKAGSGKSTLMKYLYQSPRAQYLIAQWASGPHAIVKFFFWNLGTTEQRSQEGLSRTLLYQILSNNKDLIENALPNMWKEALDTEGEIRLPSSFETACAFKTLSENCSSLGKMCFFIDGLDEFSGNYMDGIRFIQELAANQSIKIVVSSRPIPDCVAAFEGMPKLYLHQLTKLDIQTYVHDTVGGHTYMKGLIKRYPEEATDIMNSVVEKASGVFLWVVLACGSLLSGFASYDRIKELRHRVDELPPELGRMFQHMLKSIEPRYREQGAELLRLCYTKRQAEDNRDMSALGLALLHEDPDSPELQSLNNENMRQLCDDLASRLRSRCGGMLELTPRNATGTNVRHCFCGAQTEHGHDSLIDGRVDFIHRTVYEFLSQDETWNLPCLQVPEQQSGYATTLSLLSLSLARISLAKGKKPGIYHSYEKQAGYFFRDGIQWGSKADQSHSSEKNIFWCMQPFLDELMTPKLTFPLFLRLRRIHQHSNSPASSHVSLVLALESGAVNYAKAHTDFARLAGGDPPNCGCFSALHHATALPCLNGDVQRWGDGDQFGFLSRDMASLLLRSGGNPNTVTGPGESARTPWETWLAATERTFIDNSGMMDIGDIAIMFLEAGADRQTRVCDVRGWVGSKFLDRPSSAVRTKGQDVLQHVENAGSENKTDNGMHNVNKSEGRKNFIRTVACERYKRIRRVVRKVLIPR